MTPNGTTQGISPRHSGPPARRHGAGRIVRRLVAVVHMDIVGYTRLVAADDVATLGHIERLRGDIVAPELARCGGALVQTAGDSLLMTFDSILGAVAFAIQVQRRVAAAGWQLPGHEPLRLRAGIEIGDAIAADADLHGDGVNIAVRLESACPPGGIQVSRTVHEHVEARIGLRFRPMGALTLKNVARPIEAYCLMPEDLGEEGATVPEVLRGLSDAVRADIAPVAPPLPLGGSAYPLRNSIAVLPFAILGDDATQAYFADGVVDDIITGLSHFRNLFVIARNSSFSYRGRQVDVREVARDLGVDYVVEGSMRLAGDRVRVSSSLVFAPAGTQIWAERFDTELTDIFQLQDTISERIACAVEPRIQAMELDRSRRKPPESLSAYDYYLRALPFCEGFSAEAIATALDLLSEAIRREPGFAPAMAAAASCHLGRHDQGWSTAGMDDKAEGLRLAREALRFGPDDARVLCLAGHTIASLAADYETGAELLLAAIHHNPNYAQAWMRSGMVQVYRNDPETAILHSNRAISLSPRDPRLFIPLCAKGYAHLLLEEYEAALQVASRSLALPTKPEMAYRIAITALCQLGRAEAMRAAAANLLRQIPTFRIRAWRERIAFTREKRFDMMEIALRQAGLPD